MSRLVALDLGTRNVKATVWNTSGRKATFTERLLEPVPQDEAHPPDLERQLLALEAMLEAHPELAAAGNVVAATFGGRHLSMHQVTLPFTDAARIDKTLPFVLEDQVPFDLDEMVLGYRIITQGDDTQTLVALAEESALKAMLDGLGARRVDPRQIVSDKELLVRWANNSEPRLPEPSGDPNEVQQAAWEPPTIAIVDIGHTSTLITLAKDGVFLASRGIDVGGADITRAIQRGLNCSWANAERLKEGLPAAPDPVDLAQFDEDEPTQAQPAPEAPDEEDATDTDIPVPDVPRTPWDQLPEPGLHNLPANVARDVNESLKRQLSAIRSSLIGFEDSLEIEVDEIRLGGGGARLTNLASALHNDLGVTIQWASDDEGQPVPCEHLLADALADIMAGRVELEPVNLRAGALRWRNGFNLLQAILMYGGALVMFFTIAMIGLYAYQTWTLSSAVAEAQARIDSTIKKALPDENIKRTSQALIKMQERIDQAEERAKALGDDGEPPVTHTVYALSKALPPPKELTIDVTSMKLGTRVLEFDAEVENYTTADQVEVALKETERFKTCTKSNEQQRGGNKVSFTVSCDFSATPEEG
ncbi:MAG: type II secretion system protein GspL [Myxococcota bacterium]